MLDLISTEDLFEDEEIILVEARFMSDEGPVIKKDVHVKDENNEVVKIITIIA